jgi:hypothetical protein
LAAVGGLLLVVALIGYVERRTIARTALLDWLRAQGVTATVEIDALGPGGAAGRVQVGDPRAPDFVAADAQVSYGLGAQGFELRTVRLDGPVLRARPHGGQLTLGGLDPLIEALRKRPPRPNAPGPTVEIRHGVLLLATDYGPARLSVDATVAGGRLMALTAVADPARLSGPGLEATLNGGVLRLVTRGGRVAVDLAATAPALTAGPLAATDARLTLAGEGPYPDLQHRRGDGPLTLRATFVGSRLAARRQRLDGVEIAGGFQGATAGWIDTLEVAGQGDVRLRANSGALGSALRLTEISAAAQGPMAFGPGRRSVSLSGRVAGLGSYSGLGAPAAADSAQIVAIKRAVRAFRFDAPALALAASSGAPRLVLTRPVSLRPETGGQAVLAERDGGYRLTVAGGGLPGLDAQIDHLVMAPAGATIRGSLRAQVSAGLVQDGRVDAAGTLALSGRGVSFTGDRCADVAADRVRLGANDLRALSARLCPAGAPLFTLAGSAWRLQGRVNRLAATAPFLQSRIADGTGRLTVAQGGGRLSAEATLSAARVVDTAAQTRFDPLRMAGTVGLARDVWTADLGFRTSGGVPVAHAALRHDSHSGVGGVDITTGTLTFAEGDLQPNQLSPLAAALGSPVAGTAAFTGRFAWDKAGTTSSGTLSIPGLDFETPAGRVSGLSGRIEFVSLSPLVTAPGQALKARSLAAIAPVSDITAGVALDAGALTISGGQASVGGGRVLVESLAIPLSAGAPIRGVLEVDGVQLHDLVEASPFGDRVDLDAKVSGRVPFEATGGKVRIAAASLHAIQPGRLSINRNALSAVAASGAVEAPAVPAVTGAVAANDTFTDFAYQAMENLAFDKLEAVIASRADGRLGVIAHIAGRHDPPKRQEIRLSLFDLIGRRFMDRKLPLPSDTAVDLTLDTTLNLDDLMADYAQYQQLRSSRPVQGKPAK